MQSGHSPRSTLPVLDASEEDSGDGSSTSSGASTTNEAKTRSPPAVRHRRVSPSQPPPRTRPPEKTTDGRRPPTESTSSPPSPVFSHIPEEALRELLTIDDALWKDHSRNLALQEMATERCRQMLRAERQNLSLRTHGCIGSVRTMCDTIRDEIDNVETALYRQIDDAVARWTLQLAGPDTDLTAAQCCLEQRSAEDGIPSSASVEQLSNMCMKSVARGDEVVQSVKGACAFARPEGYLWDRVQGALAAMGTYA